MTEITPALLWTLDRLEALVQQPEASQDWLEAIWWAAQLHHDGLARYAAHLLPRLRSPPHWEPLAPCPCQSWPHWLRHVPAPHPARAAWMAQLRDRAARLPLTVAPRSPATWMGCPIRAWLHDPQQHTRRSLLPLRCAQCLDMRDGGYLPVPTQDPRGEVYLASGPDGWYAAPRRGALLQTARRDENGALRPAPGEPLLINGIPWRLEDRPIDVLCAQEPGQRCRWLPLLGDDITLQPTPHTQWRLQKKDSTYTITPKGHAQPLRALQVGASAVAPPDIAPLDRVDVWIERWPQQDAPDDDADAPHGRWWPPSPPPQERPGKPLEALRALLYGSPTAQPPPREVFLLRHDCAARGELEIATHYLEAHLRARPAPWDRPACPCGDWGRWLAALPNDRDHLEHRLSLLYASGRALPCASAPRLIGPGPLSFPFDDLRELPLCHHTALRLDANGLLELCDPALATLTLTPDGPRRWRLDALDGDLPPITAAPLGQPSPAPHPGPWHLTPDHTLSIGARSWRIGAPYGYLRLEPAWRHGAEPIAPAFAPLFADEIQIGRLRPGPEEEKIQFIQIDNATISRRHCALTRHLGRVFAQDLHSSGGLYLNGHALRGPGLLRPDQDQLTIGDYTARLVLSPSP